MYSAILLLTMTSAGDQPQGILVHGAGCTGAAVSMPVRDLMNHRRIVRQQAAVRGSGCSGAATQTAVQTTVTTRTALVPVRATGCSGGVAFRLPVAAVGSPSTATTALVGFEGPIRRALVRSSLKKAFEQSDSPIAKKALTDPDVFEALVAKVHRDMSTKAQMQFGGDARIGKLGDGTILKMILDNLPAILAAAEKLFHLFSFDLQRGSSYEVCFHLFDDRAFVTVFHPSGRASCRFELAV